MIIYNLPKRETSYFTLIHNQKSIFKEFDKDRNQYKIGYNYQLLTSLKEVTPKY